MATVQVFILTRAFKRANMYAFYAFDKEHNPLECKITGDTANLMMAKVKVGEFAIMKNCNVNTRGGTTYVELKSGTGKIFKARSLFEVDVKKVEGFHNAERVTIAEAKASPKKRKISVQADIVQVKALKTGENWTRRDVMIRDMNGTLQLKLWNDHSEAIQEQDEGAKLTLRNVEVDIYQNQAQLKTIEISQIIVSRENTPATSGQHDIVGLDNDGEKTTLIGNDSQEFILDEDVILAANKTVEDLEEMLPFKTTIKLTAGRVTSISFH